MPLKDCFTGKKILVTGAGRGIGRSLCARLHEYGATVIALSRTEDTLLSLKEECPGITTICVDVGNWNATRTEISKLDTVDGLINNAGVSPMQDFMSITPDNLDRVLDVNLKAVVNISQVVAQKMIDAGNGGSIVNVSSVAGKWASPVSPAYSASKAALDMMTKAMAVALGPHKIRVNSISPAIVDTDLGKAWMKEWTPEAMKSLSERFPLGAFLVQIEDIVNTTLFLLSGMTQMMTGETIVIDGGFLKT